MSADAARAGLAMLDLIDGVTPAHYVLAAAGALVLCAWLCAAGIAWINWWRHVNP